MKMFNLYNYRILIFITEAIFMTLELLASRVLSPMFGTTLEVWTSIIGIILLSSALGNYYGGKLADKNNSNMISIVLFLASVSIFIIPVLSKLFFGYELAGVDWQSKVAVTLVVSILLFFLPGFIIGMLTPIVVTKEINSKKTVGKAAGTIYSFMTLGGLFGTFISGFFLIPNIGTEKLLYILSLIMLVLSFVTNEHKKRYLIIYLICSIGLIYMLCTIINSDEKSYESLNNYKNSTISIDTKYGRALISHKLHDGKMTRVLNIDGGYESAMYVDKGLRDELVFDYTKKYLDVLKVYDSPKDILMIGGGAYSFPKYILTHTDINIDVVEIDPKITNIAKDYFYLSDTIERYPNRFKNFNEDGRTFINSNNKKYNVVLNDAFSGNVPAKTLTTSEAISKIKKSLKNYGIYASNIISALDGDGSKFIKYEILTLKKHFENVYILPVHKDVSSNSKQNYIVVASDKKYTFNDSLDIDLSGARVLTDDYCPIEYITK